MQIHTHTRTHTCTPREIQIEMRKGRKGTDKERRRDEETIRTGAAGDKARK